MFTTLGPRVADCCEHEHPTRDDAQTCLVAHQAAMRGAGRVSERVVVEAESLEELFEELS